MSVLASETQNKAAACRVALHTVEKHLEPLLNKNLSEVTKKLAPLENAELQVGLAYTVASLYFCNLLTQGVDPSEHPIRQELDRIQLYFKKVRQTAEDVRENHAESARLRVDTEAMKRIVQHYTSATSAVTDAAAQRQLSSETSSASAGPLPQPAAEEGPPRKRRKSAAVGKASDDAAETAEDSGAADASVPTAQASDNQEVPVEPVQGFATCSAVPATASAAEAKPPPPVLASPAPVLAKAKPPPPLLKAAAPKAPVAKVPPPALAKVSAKAAVSKSPPPLPDAAQLKPVAAPMPSAAAKTPQGPAADAIFANAKADAQRAALKKKKKKAAKSLAKSKSVAASPPPAEEDPYGTATDDPYAAS